MYLPLGRRKEAFKESLFPLLPGKEVLLRSQGIAEPREEKSLIS